MREDGAWLSVMMAITAFEFVCWAGAWRLGFAPSPYIFTYLALAFAGLVCVLSLRGVTGLTDLYTVKTTAGLLTIACIAPLESMPRKLSR